MFCGSSYCAIKKNNFYPLCNAGKLDIEGKDSRNELSVALSFSCTILFNSFSLLKMLVNVCNQTGPSYQKLYTQKNYNIQEGLSIDKKLLHEKQEMSSIWIGKKIYELALILCTLWFELTLEVE